VQRLGKNSSGAKKIDPFDKASELGAKYLLLCEVTSNFNIGALEVEKQLAVGKKDPRAASAQLGVAGIDMETEENLKLQAVDIPDYDTVMGTPIGFRKGNTFKKQSSREVVYVETVMTEDGTSVDVYMYHANASYKAKDLVTWVSEALDQAGPFVLVGDLNCQPDEFAQARAKLIAAGVAIGSLEWDYDGKATHDGGKIYDFVIFTKGLNVGVKTIDDDGKISDHRAIFVTIG
jgi:hypothetical protein